MRPSILLLLTQLCSVRAAVLLQVVRNTVPLLVLRNLGHRGKGENGIGVDLKCEIAVWLQAGSLTSLS